MMIVSDLESSPATGISLITIGLIVFALGAAGTIRGNVVVAVKSRVLRALAMVIGGGLFALGVWKVVWPGQPDFEQASARARALYEEATLDSTNPDKAKLDKAIEEYNQALGIPRDDLDQKAKMQLGLDYLNLGKAFLYKQQYHDAEIRLKNSLNIRNDDPSVYEALAEAQEGEYNQNHSDENRESSATNFKQAAELVEHNDHNWAKIAELLRQIAELQNNDAVAWKELAGADERVPDLKGAIVALERAAQLTADPSTYRELGDDCRSKEEYDKARGAYQVALCLSPNETAAQVGLHSLPALSDVNAFAYPLRDYGGWLTDNRQLACAETILKKVTSELPDDSGGFYYLGNAFMAENKLPEAIGAYATAERLLGSSKFSWTPHCHKQYGWALMRTNNPENYSKAMEEFGKAKPDLPGDRFVPSSISEALQLLKR
jgi:tetratricopeptide (TPR) repeat protein